MGRKLREQKVTGWISIVKAKGTSLKRTSLVYQDKRAAWEEGIAEYERLESMNFKCTLQIHYGYGYQAGVKKA